MTGSDPNFLPFPFERLRRVSHRDAAFISTCAHWLDARPRGDALAALVGGSVRVTIGLGAPSSDPKAATPAVIDPHAATLVDRRGAIDPHAAHAELRLPGLDSVVVLAGSGLPIRRLAQHLLGGPHELAAPRPLTPAEHAIFALVVATACEDAQILAEVWPHAIPDPPSRTRSVELTIELAGMLLTIQAFVPDTVEVRSPTPRALATWTERIAIPLPIVVGRCALTPPAIAALAPRDIVTIDGVVRRDRRAPFELELAIGDGGVRLRGVPGAMEAQTISGYGRRDMALPDDAHLELTVTLGTTQLTLRQLVELSIGQIVPLGRPLAGPFELRAQGRVIGTGELIDVDGELGVRVLSLG